MRRGTKYVQIGYGLLVLLLSSGAPISWTTRVSSREDELPLGDQARPPIDNVRVLNTYGEGNFAGFANVHEMTRWSGILAQRIAEFVAKQRMPDSPPPPTQSINSRDNGSAPTNPPTPAYRPVFEQSPVAWSIKVVNQEISLLPQLREEVIVLVQYAPEYFQDNAFSDGAWVLAHLRNSIRQGTDIPGSGPPFCDSRGRWHIADTPKLLDQGPPESSRLEKTPNVRSYKSRPTMKQIAEFVYATDFGNNDIYSHTSVSDRMDVDVLRVVVYPEYARLADVFRAGLTPEAVGERKAAYQESFQRDGIIPSPPRRW